MDEQHNYLNVMSVIDSRLHQQANKKFYSYSDFSHLAAALWWLKSDSDRRFQEASYYLRQAEAWDIASMLLEYIAQTQGWYVVSMLLEDIDVNSHIASILYKDINPNVDF
ncbi:MAG: hypothetical protein WAN66_14190 [Limnoraphis robusta]|uniref:Uncharacterized protein n=1 Tax=Limnoraphis robusta CS-951 TaxID=1637645 RepID=A0A0F5YH64_9CYAN|nr:hypothetical protein [Limnoraphis robusta]KKD38249.1 hypothetical protein WN50_09845 [Limnoraphis robusta CS-951]